jgi:hypothetical protein
MEITLTPIQEQVDSMIEARITRLSHAAWRAANILSDGRVRRKHKPFTHPQEVHDLLALRQDLYKGADPEAIAAQVTTGEIQEKFLKSA